MAGEQTPDVQPALTAGGGDYRAPRPRPAMDAVPAEFLQADPGILVDVIELTEPPDPAITVDP